MSFRPILAATDELARERAGRILATIEAGAGGKGSFTGDKTRVLGGPRPENVGSQRLLAAAARGDRHDRALWTATARRSSSAATTPSTTPWTTAATSSRSSSSNWPTARSSPPEGEP